ncbi:hypothetical protein ACFLY4_07220 [Chloroflexota bacterium]
MSPIGEIVVQEWGKTQIIRSNVILDEWISMPNHMHMIVVITHKIESTPDVETRRRGVSTICWTCLLCRSQRFGGGQTRHSHRWLETSDTADQQCGGNTTDHGYRRHKCSPTLDVGVDSRNHDTQQTPPVPPIVPNSSASLRNWRATRRRVAPSARRSPDFSQR